MASIPLINFLFTLLFGGAVVFLLWRQRGTRPGSGETELELATMREGLRGAQDGLAEKQRQLEAKEADNVRLQEKQAELQAHYAALQATLENERRAAEEKLKLLEQAGEKMRSQFENLAQRIFEEKSKKFTDENKLNMDGVLKPLREQLNTFRKRIDDVYDKEAKDRRSLHDEITRLKELNERMSREAINLTRALKGDIKKRGNWGELILERVLEASGLVKGREYATQIAFRDNQGNRYLPDAVVHLPEGRHVIIDAKVPLSAYAAYYEAEDETTRQQHIKEHITAIRLQVSNLAGKDYATLDALNSPDMVLMFIPIEPALLLAFEHDPALFEDAFKAGVFLVSPTTLHMNLQLIHNLWRYERQNQNTQKIIKQAGSMYDKFAGFVTALDEIGGYLDKARSSWQTAYNRLSRGQGNLLRLAQGLRELGVDSKKQLPAPDDELS